ncbi:molybdopterin molybdotransferase MoeA [Clostridium sp. P21]|uniref:Molybdopterin molybdenumtransferase n=1 Tax=Clostridium muellerianum TaxID=2716538 RepID=A0A7Y0EI97_9CLOT|nr:gephyrin-like molybdotransferase Glp [Clostridium muellerianum]NMM63973.1 molybdopterin molybdotransferase MoeA [Clostridium muellerianum]
MLELIDLETAKTILSEKIPLLEMNKVNLMNCHEKVLAEDIFSEINQPPFNRSPLDGYAFRAEDSVLASKDHKIKLNVIEEIYAGSNTDKEVTPGTAIRIMTGAPIPKGANCVIKQEDTVFENGFVQISTKFSPWQNICFEGEDVRKGQLILKKGTILKHAEIGVLASIGCKTVSVYPQPKVGILSTGDELISIEDNLIPGKIYNSSLYCLYSRLKELHCDPIDMGIIGDDIDDLGKKIKQALDKSDILITTGGVSVGKKDLIKDVMKNLGADLLFWKVAIKPGSPVFCSSLNNKLVISLSGNPAACITTFEILVHPLLMEITKREDLGLHKINALLQQDFNKKSTTERFVRGTLSYTNNGPIVDITKSNQGNGILSSSLNSNCFIDIPANSLPLSKGQVVQVILI